MDEKNKQKFFEKHKALKNKQALKERKKEIAGIKKKYAKDNEGVMKNLIGYFHKTYPLFDASTGNEIARVRRPTMAEIEAMIPPDGAKSINELKQMSEDAKSEYYDENKKHIGKQWEIVSDLVTVPKQDAKWWNAHAPPDFLALVQQHINDILSGLAEETKKVVNFQ